MGRCASLSEGPVLRSVLYFAFVVPVLISCGGGGGGGGSSNTISGGNNNTNNNTDGWIPGVFLPASTYQSMCASPVPGSGDFQGTVTDENNFLRPYSNDTYLWYDEIVDRDPALFSTPIYFELLKSDEQTPSGNFKDKFHFTIPTDEWNALSQAGESIGYGAQFAILHGAPPNRLVVVAYTEPNTPATAAGVVLARGEQILTIDGENVDNSNNVDALNAGFFPATAGESHTFEVRDLNGTDRTFTMQSAVITSTPVQNVLPIATASGKVGYLLFNDHIATAEGGLFDAVTDLVAAGITDLVVDVRYNGGGFLAIASELAYMIAGDVRTAGRTFEEIKFNDKHPDIDPVTDNFLEPIPFFSQSLGFDPSLDPETQLPTLDLPRVYVLTGSGTCSASESIMNSLHGVGVEVIQIGSTTCGKPYGFYPTDNCGTTYFTIQFQGVNDMGFGDYSDGFSPENTANNPGTSVPGCSVGDDFSHALGDPAEARLAAALSHRVGGGCPAASGLSAPALSLRSQLPVDDMVVPKTAWQQNRIMRR